jgi:hypothetical protein
MYTKTNVARACACLLLAVAGAPAYAQQTPAVADPQAAVPATRYEPMLGQRPDAAPASSPDRNWVAGNAAVAATNSMSLTMKPMAGQAADPHAGHTMPGMGMDKKDAPAMCMPGGGDAKGEAKGMQCMGGGESGKGKMACCESGCGAGCCCKDKMKKKDAA